MNKEKVIIYPVDSEYLPFLKYSNLFEDTEITGCYAPKGWFYVNKKIQVSNDRVITIQDINECKDISTFDALWVVNSNGDIDFETTILPIIQQAAKENKAIRITRSLTNEEYKMCSEVCEQYGSLLSNEEKTYISSDSTPRILNINTPVVFVFGIFEHTDKLDTLLYLHGGAKKAGYRVKTILSRKNETDIRDFISFPDFMYDRRYSDTEKILYFNHFLRRMELDHKPDIILIGLPGEIMPLDDKHNGNFGVIPYLVSNAVHCDYAVLKLFHNFYDSVFAEKLQEICRNKFEIDINAFAVSNNMIDAASISTSTLKFYTSDKKPVALDENYYFNHINGVGESLCDHLILTLQNLGKYRMV
ncbi:TIGR04066 family peptide maturation system protein [Paenibacillus albidus]|uniref:TIGR04066 family peptide maturation system protein n=1 Tax=Paenibacillus albidus TaxID=2041023 RepID=UPI001BE9E9D6|nr:TIGR04066 family peptide maturation system protein [Paenibacillus albidus]MBT2290007.1 TIGR04066 family peptide maturation system protein [Paenibacillus albidus]